MSCEEELNALRRAEQDLARYRQQHPGLGSPGPVHVPAGGAADLEPAEAETLQRIAELTTALREKQDAYNECRGRAESVADLEALMRDATGRPLGGGAGPPM